MDLRPWRTHHLVAMLVGSRTLAFRRKGGRNDDHHDPATEGPRQAAPGLARSGDPVAIASYLGKGKVFDRAVTGFAERYAEQNQQDYDAFMSAIRDGRLEVSLAETL